MMVINRDVKNLYDFCVKYVKEIVHSNSVNDINVIPQDLDRFDKYAGDFEKMLDKYNGETHLDTPHSNKNPIDLAPLPPHSLENPYLGKMCDRFDMIVNELINCQSAKYGSGLKGFDYGRIKELVESLKGDIAIARDAGEIDMPEFSTVKK